MAKYAAEQRSKYGNLKTQIRFTDDDLQLLVKTKGSDEPFAEIKLEEIEKEVGKLPNFEHNLKWKRKEDRPSWRRTSPEVKIVELRSLAMARTVRPHGEGAQGPAKKHRQEGTHKMNADSSMSEGSN